MLVDHEDGIEVGREPDLFALANSLYYRLSHRVPWFYNVHTPLPLSRADMFHLFGGVSTSRRPWVTTAECGYYYERIGPLDGMRFLARGRCRRILCMSRWSRDSFALALDGHPASAAVLEKAVVLHPPQAVVPRREAFDPDGEIRLFMVGAEFFRKGGLEVLRAFAEVEQRHPALRLEIVSALRPERFPQWWQATSAEIEEARGIIGRLAGKVTHHERLPNTEVLRKMATAAVGLLPTFNDTYGYSALELMAAGCPVVATNQRALAELVAPDRGWVVELPVGHDGMFFPRNRSEAGDVSRDVTNQLAAIFQSIAEDPHQVAVRGERAVAYIRANHDPRSYAAQLSTVYRQALGGGEEPAACAALPSRPTEGVPRANRSRSPESTG